ncbi:hypothetical protein [Arcobacter arenosus]|uniref:Uncharacterized protein n=1 Tax=Arcobacter arenosus TaxID=2576037 RepID=A0A5R8XWY0_9BACT|nr:hypothetical protein [Arcobacter arenosus]TLP35517.1 hypothetical protein FDK22_14810 [Arcobacter arenosus]
MSGSNSSGRSFTGGGSSFIGGLTSGGGSGSSGGSFQSCSKLKGSTKVISPTMTYFSTVKIGEILKVELDEDMIVLVNKSNDQVGGINPPWVIDLIECIKQGNKYIAKIMKINGAAIDVFVEMV